MLSCGGKSMRFILLALNALLFIMALGIVIGAAANMNANFLPLLQTWLVPALILGLFILAISTLGMCGAQKESTFLLWIYALLDLLFGLIILIISIYALAQKGQESNLVKFSWNAATPGLVNSLEITFQCCGLVWPSEPFSAVCTPDPQLPLIPLCCCDT